MASISHILLVDDDDDVRELTAKILQNEGYVVDQAIDGVEAVEQMKPGKYRVVLIDHMMPRLTGEEAALRIRDIDPRVGIILLTGFRRALSPSNLRLFDTILEKPVTPSLILDALRELPSPVTRRTKKLRTTNQGR